MRGLKRIIIASVSLAGALACADTTAPSAASSDIKSATNRPSLEYVGSMWFSGYKSSYIQLTSSGGAYDIGNGLYTLDVPQNAVCVLTSTYGPAEWDAPCQTLADGESIFVRVTTGFANGGPVIDFYPNLRFNPDARVTLSTAIYASILVPNREFFAANPWAMNSFGVYYTPDFGVSGNMEAASDSTLITHVNLETGLVWRRVKHFSGYNIAAGIACDPSPNDPDCVETAPDVVR